MKTSKFNFLLFVILLLILSANARLIHAQESVQFSPQAFTQQIRLTAFDAAPNDNYGSVAIDRNIAVVGSLFDDIGAASDQGSVHVYFYNGSIWINWTKLTAPDGAAGDRFGVDVAISDDTIVVGAFGDDSQSGAAYVFTRSGIGGPTGNGSWTFQQKLVADDAAANSSFGVAVDISGDTIIVGANLSQVNATAQQGAAYVFTRAGTVWTQQQKIVANDGITQSQFGQSVAVQGDTAVVGAYQDRIGTNNAQGSAYVFTRGGATWTQRQKLTAADGLSSDFFGRAVALSGNSVAVTASGDDFGSILSQGSVYVFVNEAGAGWMQQQKLFADDGGTFDNLGYAISIRNNELIVGAFGDDNGTIEDQGSAYVFTRGGTTWTQTQKLLAGDGASGDGFGASIGFSNNKIIIGAFNDDTSGGVNSGSAYVFAAPQITRRAFDFDADGKADFAVFRPSSGVWYLQQSTAGFTGIQFGISTDKVVPADYDADGKTDLAVYRNGVWYLQRSQAGFTAFQFGTSEDIPAPADFDGDGSADFAVFRPSNGVWYLQRSNAGFLGVQFGLTGDKPVPGDYDGDGKADIAVFRPSNGTWYQQRSLTGAYAVQFGISTDKVIPADYDADGKTDVTVFRPSTGIWYTLRSSGGLAINYFGIEGDVPAAADYDGDGDADIAVFRNGTWYWQRTETTFTVIPFGNANDVPIPGAFVQ